MVGGRRLLLSIAALSGAGLNSGVEARFRRQDGAGVDVVQNATTPISEPTTPIITSYPTPPPTPIDLPGTPTTFTTSKKVPPIGPPRPGVSVASVIGLEDDVDLEEDEVTIVEGGGLLRLTAASARPTPAAEDYVYPGVYGADGTLTTDTNAFTRTVLPTRISVVPNPGTVRGPPPVETTTSVTAGPIRTPPSRPPAAPAPIAAPQDEVENIDLGSPAGLVPEPEPEPEPEEEEPAPAPAPVLPGIPGVGRPAGPPTRPSAKPATSAMETTFDLGFQSTPTPTSTWNGYSNSTFLTSVLYPNQTTPHVSTPTTTLSFCQLSDRLIPPTVWSVVHTSTLTWYGNPEDYTPEYPPISTPPPTSTCVESPIRLTISHCTSTGTGKEDTTCVVTTTTSDWAYAPNTSNVPNTVTFVTTDKNPAVVYTSMKPPNYGVTQPPRTQAHHESLTEDGGGNPISTPSYGSEPNEPGNNNNPNNPPPNPNKPQPVEESRSATPTRPPVTVIIQPTAIVINDNTIKDNTTKKTQVVIVSGETFTIEPTRVVGADTTIDRVTATGGGVFYPPTPTTTSLRGVEVVLTSSLVLIGGSTYTLSPTSTIAVVAGETFTIGPTAVAAGTQTFNLPAAPVPTEVVIVGGELVTAIGPSVAVISGTTITYGPALSTTTIGDDVITFGPSGIVSGTITIGGSAARPGETQYVVAGGATITKVGASVVVVRTTTYTIGPESVGGMGDRTITTTVGGEVITIGPSGVVVGTTTMGFPFGPTVVITPGARASGGVAAATGAVQGGDEEDAAVGMGVSRGLMMAAVVGVLVWVA
ncbi:hypothetical protein QBC40DRAFT_74518 [Triangularia verruculosa]|uniref:Uncharacterized protein n=1 Tax=Triangularia verruculosa TaxID=2587418 RepID=A0AAN6XQX6_9PEZI|nr:hypothetical protein QBC40DRAFT_74518 [Triangularia verruculosa]